MKKVSPRLWCALILLGLMGQFAWTIENMYFNVFLYNTISTDPNYIAAMVAASAIVATLTTLLMGVLSDRAGRRKAFICGGYLLWGLSTAAFGLITVDNAASLFPAANAVAAAAVMVIVMDCAMTFFGSTANDAAFNAYVTDTVSNAQRGRVESVLAILPLVSMLIIFGGFDGMTQAGNWQMFFLIFGALVTLTGVASLFLLKEQPATPKREPFFQQLAYGFRPSVIARHRALYLSLLAMCVFSIAVQVFFPYLIIYMQHYLLLDNYALVLGVVLIVASAASVLGGRVIDRVGKLRFAGPASIVMLARACRDVLCARHSRRHGHGRGDDERLHAFDGCAFRAGARPDPAGKGRALPGHPHDLRGHAADDHRAVHRRGGNSRQRSNLCGAGPEQNGAHARNLPRGSHRAFAGGRSPAAATP